MDEYILNAEDIDTTEEVFTEEQTINKENFSKFFTTNQAKAEELINDPDKLEKFLQKLEKKLSLVPIAGTALAYVPVMISLVRMYVKKEYTEIPLASIIAIIVALIYLLSPFDLIHDAIPGVGLLDDGIVIAGCLAIIRSDIEDYKKWREEHGFIFDDIPNYDDIEKEAMSNKKVFNAFFKGKNNK